MVRLLAFLFLAGGAAFTSPLASAADKLPLRVLYLGNDPERTAAFEQFLAERFAFAATRMHDAFERKDLERVDVVLLDWSQREAFVPRSDSALPGSFPFAVIGDSPLGDRDTWTTPTVLLGSAGLLLAGFWEIAGGSG